MRITNRNPSNFPPLITADERNAIIAELKKRALAGDATAACVLLFDPRIIPVNSNIQTIQC